MQQQLYLPHWLGDRILVGVSKLLGLGRSFYSRFTDFQYFYSAAKFSFLLVVEKCTYKNLQSVAYPLSALLRNQHDILLCTRVDTKMFKVESFCMLRRLTSKSLTELSLCCGGCLWIATSEKASYPEEEACTASTLLHPGARGRSEPVDCRK